MLEGKFHQYLQVERNYSPHTILAYTQDLKSFDTFLKEHYSLDIFQEKDASGRYASHDPRMDGRVA